MLEAVPLLDEPGLRVTEVRCAARHAGWCDAEPVTSYGVVLVRRGVFRRRVDGVESLADPVTGYVQRPGGEQQIAHPAGGDVCTSITVDRPADRPLVVGPVLVAPYVELIHRRLRAAAGTGDLLTLADHAAALVAALLPGRPGSAPAGRRHRLVDQARQALYADPTRRLTALATELAVSPYHLSRVFHQVSGVTLSGYRARLRAHRALDRLAAGDAAAGRIAAELGYADQAHLTRSLKAQVGLTPGQVRRLLHG